ncbi:DUF6056 family protein [Ruminococcus sp.]|uniref:DUF6056 family protein n=1 Tax=Ruminococcus sp. TaxID=41978 RepID=UPI00345CC098
MRDYDMKNKSNLLNVLPYGVIALFVVCTSLALFMNGDDFLWYFSRSDEALSSWTTPNGRLFSNQMTYWLVRSILFRTIFISITFFAFIILLSKLFDIENKCGKIKYYAVLFSFVCIPPATYAETVNWISGYTNYIFSLIPIFSYLFFMFRYVFSDRKPPLMYALIFTVLGLVGGLCVEHITIYSVILAAAMLVIVLKNNRKCVIHAVGYLIGAVVSCVIMFSSSAYSEIYSDGDSVGGRQFKFDFSDIMHNAYSYVVMHYTKDYWALGLILTIGLSVLYFRSSFGEKKPKYLDICMRICWVYAAYSVFTSCVSNIVSYSPAMKLVAIETAFSFLYVISIAYLVTFFLSRNGSIRACIYLVSTFILTAVFVFISPVTARCFFANYIFWILLCGEVVSEVIKGSGEKALGMIERLAFTAAMSAAFLISYECLSNKYYNELRFDYIEEQMQDKNCRSIRTIILPYGKYVNDDLEDGLFDSQNVIGKFEYSDYILRYYGIDVERARQMAIIKVSVYDYNIEKEM